MYGFLILVIYEMTEMVQGESPPVSQIVFRADGVKRLAEFRTS